MENQWTITADEELGYVFRSRPEINPHDGKVYSAELEAYLAYWTYQGGSDEAIVCLQNTDSGTYPDFVDPLPDGSPDFARGERLIAGTIKWDGCTHLQWRETYIHFCGRDGVKAQARVLLKLYDLALAIMPERAEYLGEYPKAEIATGARDLPVEEVEGMAVRSLNFLRILGVTTLGDLLAKWPELMASAGPFGRSSAMSTLLRKKGVLLSTRILRNLREVLTSSGLLHKDSDEP